MKKQINEFFSDHTVQVAKAIGPQVMDAIKSEMERQNMNPIDQLDPESQREMINRITQYIEYELMLELGLTEKGDEERDNSDMPGFEGTTDALNNISIRGDKGEINESIKQIRNDFNRFL
jgi:hypothetical protein